MLAAWSGAAVFAASLLYCAYVYVVRLGRVETAATHAAAAVAINLGLFSVFALHHSIFARTGARAWIARRVPAGLERTVYVWVASLLFMAVCWWWQPLPGAAWRVHGAGRWLLHGLQAAGLVLTARSAARLDIWELAGIRQARAAASPAPRDPTPPRLEIRGAYRWVRHPIYLGWVLLVWPVPDMTLSRLAFAVISTAYLMAAIPFEERSLTDHFGRAYAAYQRQVRWRLIPFLW